MKLVNLKSESDESLAVPYPIEQYGYGLRLHLDDDACEKLGIAKAMRSGAKVKIQASAIVVSSTERLERDGDDAGPDICLDLQITDMGIEQDGMVRNAAAVLYGGA